MSLSIDFIDKYTLICPRISFKTINFQRNCAFLTKTRRYCAKNELDLKINFDIGLEVRIQAGARRIKLTGAIRRG